MVLIFAAVPCSGDVSLLYERNILERDIKRQRNRFMFLNFQFFDFIFTGVVYVKFSKASEAALAMEEMNMKTLPGHPKPLKVTIK